MPTTKKILFGILISLTGIFNLLACTPEPSTTANEITDQWAVKLVAGTVPETVAKEYDANLLGSIGSLKDTWLLLRPGFNLPDNQDPLRKDNRVIWLERQITHPMQKRPTDLDNSYIK